MGNRRNLRLTLPAVMAAALAPASLADNLLTNGGFEAGDFRGWTARTNGLEELFPWTVGPTGTGTTFATSDPLFGAYSAMNGFDGQGGLVYELFQDVTITGGPTATLIAWHRIQFDSLGHHSHAPRLVMFSVRDTNNQVLEMLYEHHIHIHGQPYTDLGWERGRWDLSAYIGQTVRIHFEETIGDDFTGPALIEFDGINLFVPGPGCAGALVAAGIAAGRRRRGRQR